MERFPGKYPDEVRNASVDFADTLAPGETLTGNPAVECTRGDMTVSNVIRVGSEVQFRLTGGTVEASDYRPQVVAVKVGTSAGQLLEEEVAVPILS